MKVEELKKTLVEHGWTEDKYGNFQRAGQRPDNAYKLYRMKINKIVVREEVRIELSEGNEWMRLRSANIKALEVVDGKFVGFKR